MQVTIHKLVWHLQAATEQAAVVGQKVAAQLSRSSTFLAELEAKLEALIPDDEHVIIPKLDIDLGKMSEAEFNRNCSADVLRKVQLEIGEISRGKLSVEIERVPLAKKRAIEFAYHVTTGNMPKSWPKTLRTQTDVAQWLAAMAKENGRFFTALIESLFSSQEAMDALANMPTEIYLKVFTDIFTRNATVAAQLAKALHVSARSGDEEAQKKISLLVWRYILQQSETESGQLLAEVSDIMKAARALPTKKNKTLAKKPGLTKQPEKRPTQPLKNEERAIEESKQQDFKEESGGGYFVQNAGLVLVAPFLSAFFTNLGVVQHNEINNPSKAISLLAELDLGKHGNEAVSHTLYKVLLGIPLEDALPDKSRLTKNEKQEVEELLKAIIGHWPALKNTSPDGLRTGFFWREGLISTKENAYQLKVETKAQDVLLGSLPWSISVIKLPWMKDPLHVDWT